MADKTQISWTDATWNPITGCSKVSQGCHHCYAEREWPRLSAPRPKPNIYTGRKFTDVQCHPQRLDQPLRWRKPRLIFVNSMSDLFHEDVPNHFICSVFEIMAAAKHHVFQVLTKRPERMKKILNDPVFYDAVQCGAKDLYSYKIDATNWPLPNVWLGVSVEDQETANQRIPILLDTTASVRWLSMEPLLGPVNLNDGLILPNSNKLYPLFGGELGLNGDNIERPSIDWMVVGGESGPKARSMESDWVRSLRDQCHKANKPFFFKQWGEWGPNWLNDDEGVMIPDSEWMDRQGKKIAGRELDGQTWSEMPA